MKKKVLAIACNPINTPRLALDSEIRDLQEAFQRSQHRDRFEFEWRIVKTYEDFRRSILDVKPNIIHFCGHGTKEGLVLADDQNYVKVAGNEVLVDFLKIYADRIECFLLNACDTEPLADALVQHLNYVVGMNQPVYDDAAKAFSQSFYDGIGAGDSYETAFEIGQNAVLEKRFGAGRTFKVVHRKLFAVEQDGEQVEIGNQEHLIPVIKVNSNPTPIKSLWLDPEVERKAVRDLLEAIESGFNTIKLFHTNEPIVLKDQYIPVQVTLERRYKHSVETIGGYAESEAELRRIYAMKGSSEEEIKEEIKRQQVDWEEARRQHSRIVVLADPGMGKSTLLRREVVTSVQEGYKALEESKPVNDIPIPMFIRLSSLADEVETMPVGEAILKIIQERHFTLLKEHENAEVVTFLNAFLKKQLLNGKALLLLDALDEVPDGKRQKILEKLNEFAKANQTNPCPIIGTSRIVGYGGRFVDGAKDVEIVPFTQKQTEEYIDRWFEYAPLSDESVSARGLIQALRERPQLAGLAQNPLLLSLICSLYQQDYLALPVRRCQLYEQAINYMLERWITDNGRKRITDDDRQSTEEWIVTKKELLEELAYQFSCEGKQLFSFGELREKLKKYLKSENASDLEGVKAADLIKELCEQDGILQRWSAEDDRLPIERRRYLFLHRTFQEYLTASYLSKADEDEIEFEKLFWNYDWHETISLVAGLMYEPIDLIRKIINTKDDIFQTQLLLAGRCIAECNELSDPLVDEIIDRIYQFWLTYPDAEFIRSTVVAIGQTQLGLVQNLQAALNDESSDVRRNAAVALGQIGNDKMIDSLIAILNDEDSVVRGKAAGALRLIGGGKAIDALIAILNNEDSDVRGKAVVALEQIGGGKATDALIAALNDEDSDVRWKAAEALGQLGNYKAIDALIATLNDEDSYVRVETAAALGQIRGDKAIDALIAALNDEDSVVRWNAAEALRLIGGDKAIDGLIAALNHEYKDVRWRAVETLGQIEDSKAIDALIAVLNDEYSDVRVEAAAALGRSGGDKAIDVLIAALNSDVGWNAAEALAQIGGDKVIDALIAVLNDEYSRVRGKAAEALAQIGGDKAIDVLIATLNGEDSYIRVEVAVALGKSGGDKAINVLIATLNGEDSRVREKAAEALGRIGGDKAIDALIAALNDEYSDVREKAAEALAQIGSVVCLEKLLQSAVPDLIERSDVFFLARRWAIRFSKSGSPFIPVYPELLSKADRNPD